MHKLFLLLIILCCHGCTVVHYNSHGLNKSSTNSNHQKNCEISYFIKVSGFHKNRKQDELAKYNQRAKETFNALGCKSTKLAQPSKNGLLINVQYNGYGGASGQELLTGLSLGLIPSWTTRESMYIYSISNEFNTSTYKLDQTSYNHLVLFPFIWVNLITDNEKYHFSQVLTSFIKNT